MSPLLCPLQQLIAMTTAAIIPLRIWTQLQVRHRRYRRRNILKIRPPHWPTIPVMWRARPGTTERMSVSLTWGQSQSILVRTTSRHVSPPSAQGRIIPEPWCTRKCSLFLPSHSFPHYHPRQDTMFLEHTQFYMQPYIHGIAIKFEENLIDFILLSTSINIQVHTYICDSTFIYDIKAYKPYLYIHTHIHNVNICNDTGRHMLAQNRGNRV